MEFDTEFISIIFYAITAADAHFHEVVDLFGRYNAVGIVYISVRTGKRNDFGAQFSSFLANTPANITEAGSGDRFAFNVEVVMF